MIQHLNNLSALLQTNLAKKGTQLYFLRHGQSIGNQAGSIVGWTDSKLSVKGRQQSNQIFRALYSHISKFTHIHSSDLSRCKDTLNLALGFPDRQINYTASLRELNFGDDQGVHFDSLPAQQKAIVNSLKYEPPNGQTWPKARSRAMNYLRSLGQGHHFIVAHGGLMCALHYEIGLTKVVSNCSLVSSEYCLQKKELSKLNFVWQFQGHASK